MLKQMLDERGIALTEELSKEVINDIRFNRISFNKKTSLEELLKIAEIYNTVCKRCA